MQKSERFNLPTTTTTSNFHHIAKLHLGSSITDPEKVIFGDPCSMCGTKKRRIASLYQDFSFFKPRKKLFNKKNNPPSSNIPLFQQQILLSSSSSPDSPSPPCASLLRRCNSAPLPSFLSKNPVSESPISSPVPFLGYSGSFSGISDGKDQSAQESPASISLVRSVSDISQTTRSSAEGASPTTESLPPRPPVLLRSVSDVSSTENKILMTSPPPDQKIEGAGGGVKFPGSGSDSETRRSNSTGESPDQKRLERMRGYLAEMNNWLEQDRAQKEERLKTAYNDEIKEVCEFNTGEGKVETEDAGVGFKGIFNCSCGKNYKVLLSIN